jgi:hypothetical protein
MTDQDATGRVCPKCGSGDHAFRSRKKAEAQPEKGELAAAEPS